MDLREASLGYGSARIFIETLEARFPASDPPAVPSTRVGKARQHASASILWRPCGAASADLLPRFWNGMSEFSMTERRKL